MERFVTILVGLGIVLGGITAIVAAWIMTFNLLMWLL